MIKSLVLLSLLIPAHSWYPRNCCSNQDCAPVRCEDIVEQNNGDMTYGSLVFSRDKQFSSRDPKCHVCAGGSPKTPRCIFVIWGS